jgi:hypothetical protein
MPMRQIRKYHKKSLNRKSRSRKNYSNSKVVQRGGNNGRYVLPPSYFGKGIDGYYADGSSALNSSDKQHAVSQGVISANGKWAGPNLYPMMGGRNRLKSSKQKGGSNPKKTLNTHKISRMENKKTKSHK